jgi:hypothetical protein
LITLLATAKKSAQGYTPRRRHLATRSAKIIKRLTVVKGDKASVCFFMVYYKRPELTRMSLWHMAKVIKKFRTAGHECEGIVIGNEPDQVAYCKRLGLEHINHPNKPLSEKFKRAWVEALDKKKDYICWLGSNNVHSDSFWDKCLDKISGEAVSCFGTKNFTIVDKDPSNQKTMVWTRRKHHVCSCGQFFYSTTIRKTVDFNEVFNEGLSDDEKKTKDFDGSINKALVNRWQKHVIKTLDSDSLDCIDVKSDLDIEELQMLEEGAFKHP